MAGLYKRENLEHKEAFEYYYSLGQSRTIEQVAKKFGRATRTVYEWSSSFNWRERVTQRDIEIGQVLKERTINDIVSEKANYRKIIKLAIAKFVEDMKKGEIKASSINDLEKLIKLDLLLMGEATEVSKVDSSHSITPADREAINNLADAMRRDVMATEEYEEDAEEEEDE